MAREHTCAYGECLRTDVSVSVNTGSERPRFCTEMHAALWLLKEASYRHADPATRRKLGTAYEDLVRLTAEPKEGP